MSSTKLGKWLTKCKSENTHFAPPFIDPQRSKLLKYSKTYYAVICIKKHSLA